MNIIVNGREVEVVLSYEEVVARAGKDPTRIYTIVWRSAHGHFSGTLTPGESVVVYEGTIFSVSDTSSA